MTTQKSMGVLVAACIVALAMVSAPYNATAADSEEGESLLPPSCEDALRRVHASVVEHHEASDLASAILRLQAEAGAPCGFDITTGAADPAAADAIRGFVAKLSQDAGIAAQEAPEALDPRINLEGVPCDLPGEGTGTIKSYFLGVPFGENTAGGDWERVGNNKVMQVSGSAGYISGVQSGEYGTIFLGPIGIPAYGATSVMCAQTSQTVSLSASCSYTWWVFGGEAETKQQTTTKVTLTPCSGDADQADLLGLLFVTHKYQAPGVICYATKGARREPGAFISWEEVVDKGCATRHASRAKGPSTRHAFAPLVTARAAVGRRDGPCRMRRPAPHPRLGRDSTSVQLRGHAFSHLALLSDDKCERGCDVPRQQHHQCKHRLHVQLPVG